MPEVYAFQGGHAGRYRVSIQIEAATLDGLNDTAIQSAEAGDMVFAEPKRKGQHPYHEREVTITVKVRTTDLFTTKGA